jgi:hypothetical protein
MQPVTRLLRVSSISPMSQLPHRTPPPASHPPLAPSLTRVQSICCSCIVTANPNSTHVLPRDQSHPHCALTLSYLPPPSWATLRGETRAIWGYGVGMNATQSCALQGAGLAPRACRECRTSRAGYQTVCCSSERATWWMNTSSPSTPRRLEFEKKVKALLLHPPSPAIHRRRHRADSIIA